MSIFNCLQKNIKNNLLYAPFGDSLSVGLYADSKDQCFTSLFAKMLAHDLHKQVQKNGIAVRGKKVSDLALPRIDDIVRLNPDLVTIEFGTNDAFLGRTKELTTQFSDQLDEVVKILKSKTTAQLILLTTWAPDQGRNVENALVYDQLILEVGHKNQISVVNLADIWQGHPEVVGPAGRVIPDFKDCGRSDNFHPNQLGHERITQLLMKSCIKEDR